MNKDDFGSPVPLAALGATQRLTISGSEAHVTLKNDSAYRLLASIDCFARQGPTGATATVQDAPLIANTDYHVQTGLNWTVLSAITSGSSGYLYITELVYRQVEC